MAADVPDARSESDLPDRGRLRRARPRRLRPGGSSSASRGSSPTPAASTRPCTPGGRGRCGSTPASAPPRSPTSATTSSSPTAPAGCPSPSTCRPRWATTPTTPIAHGEVGKVGVAIDSLDDMRTLFDGIPLDEVSTSMTINAPAAMLLLLYQLVAEENGRRRAPSSTGTIQNDVLKEYIARGTYIYPPQRVAAADHRHLRLLPQGDAALEHHLDLRLPHGRGRGDARAGDRLHPRQRHRVRPGRASPPGWTSTTSRRGCRSSSWPRTTLLEEVAKFRAARRIWARIMRERVRRDEPEVADAALPHPDRRGAADRPAARGQPRPGRRSRPSAAVLGGTQSLHTNSFDEAIALPTEKAARLALRTQQVIAYETDVTKTVDPFAGSYVVESMTDDVEAAALELIEARSRTAAARSRRSSRASRRARSSGRPTAIALEIDSERAHRRRRQPLRPRRGGAVRAAARRPDHRGRPARAARGAARRARRRGRSSAPSTRSARPPAAPTTCSTR